MRDAADDIKDIEKQERTEKELRVAEMETNKAMCVRKNRRCCTATCFLHLVHRASGRNLLKHSKEIHSRPARTWFQDEKQKYNVVKKWREVRLRSSSAAAIVVAMVETDSVDHRSPSHRIADHPQCAREDL